MLGLDKQSTRIVLIALVIIAIIFIIWAWGIEVASKHLAGIGVFLAIMAVLGIFMYFNQKKEASSEDTTTKALEGIQQWWFSRYQERIVLEDFDSQLQMQIDPEYDPDAFIFAGIFYITSGDREGKPVKIAWDTKRRIPININWNPHGTELENPFENVRPKKIRRSVEPFKVGKKNFININTGQPTKAQVDEEEQEEEKK